MNRVSRARDMARSMARQGKTQLALVAETWLDVKLSAKQRLTLASFDKPTGARYGR